MSSSSSMVNTSSSTVVNSTDNSSAVSQVAESQFRLRFGLSLTCCASGTFFAVALLIFLIREKLLRSSCTILISHLLVVETLIYLLVPVQLFIELLGPYRIPGSNECFVTLFFLNTLMYMEGFCHLMLAINRFCAIIFPQFYRIFFTKKIGVGMIVLTFVAPLAINIPAWFNHPGPRWNIKARVCIFTYQKTLAQIQSAVGIYFPFVASFLLYSIICLKLAIQKSKLGTRVDTAGKAEDQSAKIQKRRFKITQVLFATAVFHLACFIPHAIIRALALDIKEPWFAQVTRSLIVFGFSSTPIILVLMNSEYRKGIAKLLCCRSSGMPIMATHHDKTFSNSVQKEQTTVMVRVSPADA